MNALSFVVESRRAGSGARAGRMLTPHGLVHTPAFMPVGTQAAVKSLTPDELAVIGTEIILANAYHLYLRPGPELIAHFGGLHQFMGWDGPILTDSGGFQVFSLGFGLEQGVGKIARIFPEQATPQVKGEHKPRLTSVDEEGVTFISHLDGLRHRFTATKSIETQQLLGADIILAFDECTSPLASYEYTRKALQRTHHWAEESLAAKTSSQQALFGIVQGGEYRDLREESAQFIGTLPFDGFAIGGSLGKSKRSMYEILEWTVPLLPDNKPRHLLGIGEPEDLFEGVQRGIDLFDCVAPTRLARHGMLYTRRGRINIKNAQYREDQSPIEAGCPCPTCRHFAKGYLRHLFVAGELLAFRLATLHNLRFILNLMREIRESILAGRFFTFKEGFLAEYRTERGERPPT